MPCMLLPVAYLPASTLMRAVPANYFPPRGPRPCVCEGVCVSPALEGRPLTCLRGARLHQHTAFSHACVRAMGRPDDGDADVNQGEGEGAKAGRQASVVTTSRAHWCIQTGRPVGEMAWSSCVDESMTQSVVCLTPGLLTDICASPCKSFTFDHSLVCEPNRTEPVVVDTNITTQSTQWAESVPCLLKTAHVPVFHPSIHWSSLQLAGRTDAQAANQHHTHPSVHPENRPVRFSHTRPGTRAAGQALGSAQNDDRTRRQVCIHICRVIYADVEGRARQPAACLALPSLLTHSVDPLTDCR